ncbi:MAG: response regulator [FCB group bacterium]|nr:response regulator [FCB group bacterium]
MAQNHTRKKILIIDEELSFVDFITAFLDQNQMSVISADDGLTGLKLARSERPDLILLAVMLPEIDGLHVCRLLKFDQKYQDIPIILITDQGASLDTNLLTEIRGDLQISKPIEPESFLESIRQITETKKW